MINSRDNYLCVIITLSPKQEKIIMGKLNDPPPPKKKKKNGGVKLLMTKRHTQANIVCY